MKNIIKKIQNEFNSYSLAEKFFIFAMMICSFATTAEAAITRAVSNSVFIASYGADYFPYVWLLSLPVNFAIVVFYNRFLSKLGSGRMMFLFIGAAFVINGLSAFCLGTIPFLPFILYLWKDIFVMLLFQQIWSVIHATTSMQRAKYLFGMIFGVGGVGSVMGSLVPSYFAVRLGSEKLLFVTLPIQILLLFCYLFALRVREKIAEKQNLTHMGKEKGDFFGGLRLIQGSKLLSFILFIVLGMQISATLMDFQFQSYLQVEYPLKDLRTEFLGTFFSCVNSVNIFVQFIATFFILRIFGLQMTHFLIPLILGINCLGFMVFPHFRMLTFSFGTLKSFDHSLFAIIKEMLYIPLTVEEKFKAKAFIDVFAYRSAKACASLFILGLQVISAASLELSISYLLLAIFTIWMLFITFLFRHYKKAAALKV